MTRVLPKSTLGSSFKNNNNNKKYSFDIKRVELFFLISSCMKGKSSSLSTRKKHLGTDVRRDTKINYIIDLIMGKVKEAKRS